MDVNEFFEKFKEMYGNEKLDEESIIWDFQEIDNSLWDDQISDFIRVLLYKGKLDNFIVDGEFVIGVRE